MRILFIGNSHTYFNDMPYMTAEILRAAGKDVEVTMLTRGGQKLEEHVRNEQTRFNILYGNYDLAILQENCSQFPVADKYIADIAPFKQWCDQAGTKLALYMNFESPEDTPKLDYLRSGVLAGAKAHGLPVARIGEAFAKAAEQLPHIDLHYTDRHHAGPVGSYLIALTIVHDLFGLNVTDAPEAIAYKGETLVAPAPADAKALKALVQSL